MNRTPDEIIASIEMCATSGVGNLLIGDNEMARLVLAWREKDVEIERLRAALEAAVGREKAAERTLERMTVLHMEEYARAEAAESRVKELKAARDECERQYQAAIEKVGFELTARQLAEARAEAAERQLAEAREALEEIACDQSISPCTCANESECSYGIARAALAGEKKDE